MEKLELKGKWFLPGQQEKSVFGNLQYTPTGSTRLEVYDSLTLSLNFESPDIILGFCDGKKVTLYKCYQTSLGAKELYGAEYVFIGAHFENVDELKFRRTVVRPLVLTEWLNIQRFDSPSDRGMKSLNGVVFEKPEPIVWHEDSEYSAAFSFSWWAAYKHKTCSFTQFALFELTRNNSQESFEWFMEEISSFLKLLTLFSFSPCPPVTLHLYTEDDTKIEVLFSMPGGYATEDPLENPYLIVTYQMIHQNFKEVAACWRKNRAQLAPAVNILADGINSQLQFDENRFLDTTRGIEAFHRAFRKRATSSEKQQRFEEIIADSREEHKEFLKMLLGQWSQPSLHDRIVEIINEFRSGIFETLIPDANQVVLNTKISRNYYTHYIPSYEKKALKHSELFYLTRPLQFLLLTAVLSEIGVPRDVIFKSLDRLKYRYFYSAFKK